MIKDRIERILANGVDFIDNELFHKNESESLIFNGEEVPLPTSTWKYSVSVDEINPNRKTEVLTAEQERVLFLRLNFAKLMLKKTISSSPLVEHEVEKWDSKIYSIKDCIVRYNLPMVLNFIRKFNGSNLSTEEMLSEGNLMILNAIEKFDIAKGNKFSTYLHYCIQNAFGKISKKKSKSRDMFPISLETYIENSDQDISESKESEGLSLIESLREIIEKNSANLSELELYVIKERYGLETSIRKTLAEVGDSIGKNSSNIHNVEKNALKKLRKKISENE